MGQIMLCREGIPGICGGDPGIGILEKGGTLHEGEPETRVLIRLVFAEIRGDSQSTVRERLRILDRKTFIRITQMGDSFLLISWLNGGVCGLQALFLSLNGRFSKRKRRTAWTRRRGMFIEGFTSLSLGTPGCHPGAAFYGADFRLKRDVSELFPYINAEADKPAYHEDPHSVQFMLHGFKCALYPDHLKAVAFETREEALEFFEKFSDFLNDLYARKEDIVPNYKKFQPIPVFPIFKLLPRTNCRACGFATCMAFAAALSKGEIAVDGCPDLKDASNDNARELRSMLS